MTSSNNLSPRHYTALDNAIGGFDRALRSLTRGNRSLTRPTPRPAAEDITELSHSEKRHATGLMRVNHAGEVCAQALYHGQALTANLNHVREEMQRAADEESDHLAWCEQRLHELDSRPSVLNPLWYGLSWAMGAGAGLLGDKISLGFVAATEELVCAHLIRHLESLPEADFVSKEIVKQMIVDETQHGQAALEAGGLPFPAPVKALMSLVSKTMTLSSYRI